LIFCGPESHLGSAVEGAIVSTPGYFTEKQNKALTDAIEKAGLPLLSLIPEHIAAAVGHALPVGQDQKILVYHFGGGTFDVSVLDFTDGEYSVKSSVTDFTLGGQVFDQRLVDMLLTDFQKDHNMDLRTDTAAMQRIRDACERARTELSTSLRAAITLNYLAADEKGPKHINLTLTRAKAEELFEDLIAKSSPFFSFFLSFFLLGLPRLT
jgi:molecular chaperone DnaK